MGDDPTLQDHRVQVQVPLALSKLDNIKVTLFDHRGQEVTADLYGKVLHSHGDPPEYVAQSTSVPPEAAAFFEKAK